MTLKRPLPQQPGWRPVRLLPDRSTGLVLVCGSCRLSLRLFPPGPGDPPTPQPALLNLARPACTSLYLVPESQRTVSSSSSHQSALHPSGTWRKSLPRGLLAPRRGGSHAVNGEFAGLEVLSLHPGGVRGARECQPRAREWSAAPGSGEQAGTGREAGPRERPADPAAVSAPLRSWAAGLDPQTSAELSLLGGTLSPQAGSAAPPCTHALCIHATVHSRHCALTLLPPCKSVPINHQAPLKCRFLFRTPAA